MIKHIIFDFGGVLMDLDYMRTINGFTELLGFDFIDNDFMQWFMELFKEFEKAGISEEDFIKQLKHKSTVKLETNDAIIDVWNSMMIGLKKERFEMLRELKSEYGIYLLSNSNHIHYRTMMIMVKNMFGELDFHKEFFHQAYYSQHVKMRKPDKEIFDFICEENKLVKAETLFIDDLQPNVNGARAAGLKSICHNPKTEIIEKLQGYIDQANHTT